MLFKVTKTFALLLCFVLTEAGSHDCNYYAGNEENAAHIKDAIQFPEPLHRVNNCIHSQLHFLNKEMVERKHIAGIRKNMQNA